MALQGPLSIQVKGRVTCQASHFKSKVRSGEASEGGSSKATTGQKLSLWPFTHVVKANEEFLKEVNSAPPATTRVIRKQNNLIAVVEKGLMFWTEDLNSHRIALSQSLIQARP